MELPAPVVKVHFAMVDMDQEVGPPRFLPGTHELTAKQDIFFWKHHKFKGSSGSHRNL